MTGAVTRLCETEKRAPPFVRERRQDEQRGVIGRDGRRELHQKCRLPRMAHTCDNMSPPGAGASAWQLLSYFTVKPSSRRHALCASISTRQDSSPRSTTQASRTLRVSATATEEKSAASMSFGNRRRSAAARAPARAFAKKREPVLKDVAHLGTRSISSCRSFPASGAQELPLRHYSSSNSWSQAQELTSRHNPQKRSVYTHTAPRVKQESSPCPDRPPSCPPNLKALPLAKAEPLARSHRAPRDRKLALSAKRYFCRARPFSFSYGCKLVGVQGRLVPRLA